MDKETLKERVLQVIDSNKDHIIDIGETIMKRPELGFKETETAELVKGEFEALDLRVKSGVARTGVRGDLTQNDAKPCIAVFGELDSVISRGHPDADLETGAAHACGHNAQVAGMIGTAIGLAKAGAMEYLDGMVSFFGVPAEELIEIEFRQNLIKRGVLDYLLGKPQLIAAGELDGVDISMMFHLEAQKENVKVSVGGSHNGAMAKFVRYIGKEAHAGGAPHLGINALNAAMIGLISINAQRETFQEKDTIRVHPIITKGGDLVNTVPSDVTLEMFVRAKTLAAMAETSTKVNRALRAGADAVGATCEIDSVPGYMPRRTCPALDQIFLANVSKLVGPEAIDDTGHRCGSTDMGDVSQLMPALHPYFRAATGKGHTESWRIVDQDLAYVMPAKAMALTIIDLLWENGKLAHEIAAGYRPACSSAADYRKMWGQLTR